MKQNFAEFSRVWVFPQIASMAGVLGVVFLLACWAAAVHAATFPSDRKLYWQTKEFGAVIAQPTSDKAGIYVYRENVGDPQAVNVFVNTRYIGSVKPGTWVYTEVCAGDHDFQIFNDAIVLDEKMARPILRASKLMGGQVYFFRTTDATLLQDKMEDVAPMAQDIGSAFVSKAPRAVHTISRMVPLNCSAKDPKG